MTIYCYRAPVNGCFCVLENFLVSIQKIMIFLLYNNPAEYFQQHNFLAVTKAQKVLKNILGTHILSMEL